MRMEVKKLFQLLLVFI